MVSEFMLQQTQVDTVLPYFERWLQAFPDFKSLARAPGDRVLKAWEGLGYYSRARNLHRLAQAIAARDAVPRDAADWLALPGVGPYTAAAITSIGFGAPNAVVDGNVIRILSRLAADGTPFKSSGEAVARLRPLAEALLDRQNPGDHNQAMMELGATVCVRRKPLCLICPVRRFCAGLALGNPGDFPRLARKPSERVVTERLWLERDGSLLLQRAPRGAKRLAEIFELPLRNVLRDPENAVLLATKKRSISNQRIEERIYAAKANAAQMERLSAVEGLRWVPLRKIGAATLSGPHRKWVAEILDNRASERVDRDVALR